MQKGLLVSKYGQSGLLAGFHDILVKPPDRVAWPDWETSLNQANIRYWRLLNLMGVKYVIYLKC